MTFPFSQSKPPPTSETQARVVIIDDHAAVLEMLTQVVESQGFRVVGTALEAESALQLLRTEPAEVIVLDLVLPGVSGLSLLNDLMVIRPDARVLVFTGSLNPSAMRGALSAGVLGVVEKMAPLEIFRAALHSVASGQTYFGPLAGDIIKGLLSREELAHGPSGLTKREKTVLAHVAQGMSSKEIAEKLGVSVHTVINHRSNLMKKTGLRRVAQLSLFAAQSGLIGETTQPQ